MTLRTGNREKERPSRRPRRQPPTRHVTRSKQETMSKDREEHRSLRDKAAKVAAITAIVGGVAFAVAAVCSALKEGSTKKRNWLPNTIDQSVKAFKVGFSALDCATESSDNAPVAVEAVPNEDGQGSADDQEVYEMKNGYAYGTGADGKKQWFCATWQNSTAGKVRVEYLTTLLGSSSSLSLPSVRKTSIDEKYVREDFPTDAFEVLQD